MNVFHCVESEEHVNKTSIEDLQNIVNYSYHFEMKLGGEWDITFRKIIEENTMSNAQVHEQLHRYMEFELDEFESSRPKCCIMLRLMHEFNRGYSSYINMIEQTNHCGTRQRESLSEEQYNKIMSLL